MGTAGSAMAQLIQGENNEVLSYILFYTLECGDNCSRNIRQHECTAPMSINHMLCILSLQFMEDQFAKAKVLPKALNFLEILRLCKGFLGVFSFLILRGVAGCCPTTADPESLRLGSGVCCPVWQAG